jgi:lipopolysaccharide biosynthesis protein
MQETRARLLAFYLPQFYPTPENDRWWGRGFTEWTNVTGARPLFDGHYQPHLPAHLGFYDARVPETRTAQAALARRFSIEGFCYWHYWFHGSRLLARPFDAVLSSGRPDFPFCLAWANETWSRRWHGSGNANEILQEQAYSAEDDGHHACWLTTAFSDPRYVRVYGRPLFLVYRPHDLPDPRRLVASLCAACAARGLLEPFVVGLNSHVNQDFRIVGFDGTLNFEPQFGALDFIDGPGLRIYDDREARRRMVARRFDFPVHPSVFVAWDNTPRRGQGGIIIHGSTPEAFSASLEAAIRSVEGLPHEERLVFINAWNEWGEGNHLEPDLRHGLGFLEAASRVNRA